MEALRPALPVASAREPRADSLLVRAARIATPRRVAVLLAVGTAICMVFGVLYAAGLEGRPFVYFNLDAELFYIVDGRVDYSGANAVPLFSVCQLLSAAGLTALVAYVGAPGSRRLPWALLALFFTYMAADDLLTVHEELEQTTGINWQVLYLPAFVIGAATAAAVLLALRRRPLAAWLLVGGGVGWALGQVSEALQWSPDLGSHDANGSLMPFEELFEMVGSSLFVLAMLVALRWALGVDEEPAA